MRHSEPNDNDFTISLSLVSDTVIYMNYVIMVMKFAFSLPLITHYIHIRFCNISRRYKNRVFPGRKSDHMIDVQTNRFSGPSKDLLKVFRSDRASRIYVNIN